MKRRKIAIEDIFLDVPSLEMHRGTCKKVIMYPTRYKHLGNELIAVSAKIESLVGVDGAQKITKCKFCYKS